MLLFGHVRGCQGGFLNLLIHVLYLWDFERDASHSHWEYCLFRSLERKVLRVLVPLQPLYLSSHQVKVFSHRDRAAFHGFIFWGLKFLDLGLWGPDWGSHITLQNDRAHPGYHGGLAVICYWHHATIFLSNKIHLTVGGKHQALSIYLPKRLLLSQHHSLPLKFQFPYLEWFCPYCIHLATCFLFVPLNH